MPGDEATIHHAERAREAARAMETQPGKNPEGPMPRIDDRMNRLAAELDHLQGIVDLLGDKLTFVLAPTEPSEPSVVPDRPVMSLLAGSIDSYADRVMHQAGRIAALIDRLEC